MSTDLYNLYILMLCRGATIIQYVKNKYPLGLAYHIEALVREKDGTEHHIMLADNEIFLDKNSAFRTSMMWGAKRLTK